MKKEITSIKIIKKNITLIISVILLVVFLSLKLTKITIINHNYVILSIILSLIIAGVFFLYKVFTINNALKNIYYQIVDFFVMLNFALLFIQIFFMVAYFPATVYKSSMYPNLKELDNLIVLSTEKVNRADIVVLKIEKNINTLNGGVNDKELIVKRVIATSGDTFFFNNGILYLNGEAVDEQYLKDENGNFYGEGNLFNTFTANFSLVDKCYISGINQCTPDEVCIIPEDYIFVLGDNRQNSIDSRMLGLFHKSQIIGVAKYKQVDILKWVKL